MRGEASIFKMGKETQVNKEVLQTANKQKEDRENLDAHFETVYVDPMRNSAVAAGSQDMRSELGLVHILL